jgi:hypothetical protein
MQTKPTDSPVPGVIPEPPRRRNPLAKLLSHLRGDRYMIGAYPPGKER